VRVRASAICHVRGFHQAGQTSYIIVMAQHVTPHPDSAAAPPPAMLGAKRGAKAWLEGPGTVKHQYVPGQTSTQTSQPSTGKPPQRDCGHLPFLIQRDGGWLYQGTQIKRKPMVCLFASVLRRDGAGRYRLETPVERGEIEVEDVPFVAVELDWHGSGRSQVLSFRTNVDQIVTAGPDHPLEVDWDCARRSDECVAIPYLTVRPGDGAHPIQARIGRAVYYELVALAVEGTRHGEPCLGVWSQNRFFPIGPLTEAILGDDDDEA
jgi:hypothetical protein